MKINPISFYRKINQPSVSRARGSEPPTMSAGKTDTVDFSAESRRKSAEQMPLGISAEILQDVGTPENSARLEKLRTAISGGTYHIPSEKLAEAILNGGRTDHED